MVNIEPFEFQDEAVKYLIDKTTTDTKNRTIVLKAPTGSGKTIILIDYIDTYLNNINDETCFIWLCPGDGELEEQSKHKMDKLLPDKNTMTIQDSLQQGFNAGCTVFINWQMVVGKSNNSIKNSERKNLYDRIADAHRKNLTFILIIDEEHKNNTSKAKSIIDAFSAKHLIRVSATTVINKADDFYEIDEISVINSGLITRAMYINEDINKKSHMNFSNEYNLLIDSADKKRKDIKNEYIKLNKKIEPMIIIQFPPSSEDQIELVEKKLENMGYTYKNKLVAKWLSDSKDKINLEGLTDNGASPLFLIMKQAISTGWDCPRAKILVKLRENMSETFEIQTIGRIRRMPEARHYDIDLLDFCYLYTFDDDYKNSVIQTVGAFEVKKLYLKQKCKTFTLEKQWKNKDNDGLGERETLLKVFEYLKQKYSLTGMKQEDKKILENNGYDFSSQILKKIPRGKYTTLKKMGETILKDNGEYIELGYDVNTHTHGIDMLHSIDIIKKNIGMTSQKTKVVLKKIFHKKWRNSKYNIISLSNHDFYAFIINNVNNKKLRDDFADISQQLAVQLSLPDTKTTIFNMPFEDFYMYDSNETSTDLYLSNAYEKYDSSSVVEGIRSMSERLFERYCEERNDIDWVYKNGDTGQQYFSIVYTEGYGKQKLFYPDYIIKKLDGSIWIIETKGGERGNKSKNIDRHAINKFNALREYAKYKNIKWAFVRDKNESLKINNTIYSEELSTEYWKPIEEIF